MSPFTLKLEYVIEEIRDLENEKGSLMVRLIEDTEMPETVDIIYQLHEIDNKLKKLKEVAVKITKMGKE